jgi:hypothetical protein
MHDFGTGRLRRCSISTFQELCDRAETELADRKPDQKIERLRRLMRDDVSFEATWNELNNPSCRPTPQATIEAIWLSIRERGLKSLKETKNKQRLASCDASAQAELTRRIQKLGGAE